MKLKHLLAVLLFPLAVFGVSTNKIDNLWLPGPIRISSGAPGVGKALISDASGFGTWQTISVSSGDVFTQSNNTFVAGKTNTFNGVLLASNINVNAGQFHASQDGTNYFGATVSINNLSPGSHRLVVNMPSTDDAISTTFLTAGSAIRVPLSLQGFPGQTANLFQIYATNGALYSFVGPAGTNFINTALSINNASPGISNQFIVNSPVTARTAAVLISSVTSNQVPFAVQARTGQTTAIEEWQNSNGTAVAQMSALGRLTGLAVSMTDVNSGSGFGGAGINQNTVTITGSATQTNLVFNQASGHSSPVIVINSGAGVKQLVVESNGVLNVYGSLIMLHGGTNFISTFGSDQKNVAMGNESGPTSNPGTYSENSLYGYKSGFTIANNSSFNTLIGSLIGSINAFVASKNTIIGESAGQSLGTAAENTVGGYGALANGVNINNNTAWGSQALNGKSGGNPSAAFGYFAGVNESTGGHNTYLGFSADGLNTGTNMISLGSFANPRNHNTGVIGRTDVNMLIGIMTNAAAANLHVNGTFLLGTNGTIHSNMKSANAVLDFGTVPPGAISNLTIACTGATTNMSVIPGWPTTLPGLCCTRMWASQDVFYVQISNPQAVANVVTTPATYTGTYVK